MTVAERLIVVVLFEGVDLLDVTGPPEVFALLRRELDQPTGYRVMLAAATTDPVTTAAGVRILPDTTYAELASVPIDTLVVPGAVEFGAEGRIRAVVDPVVSDWVAAAAPRCRRVASVCVGAHILAAAGLLDGKRATTHWSTADQLAAEYPRVEVDADPIFIRDGDVWTGAGLSSCIDLSLALVAEDFGDAAALRVARQLVVFLKRPGGQSQFSVSVDPASTTRRMDDLRHYIARNIARPLSVGLLAKHLHVTERHVTRVFKTELGTTPAVYIEAARVEAARNRLETTDDTLTRAFRRRLDTTPTEYRNRFRMAPGTV